MVAPARERGRWRRQYRRGRRDCQGASGAARQRIGRGQAAGSKESFHES